MENATATEHSELKTMKLSIFYFLAKLENFIEGTNVTDANLLQLLSRLTDSIDTLVSSAKVVHTDHVIESEIDRNILFSVNIFECSLCNQQTGETYDSIIRHISNVRHNEQVKKLCAPISPTQRQLATNSQEPNGLDNVRISIQNDNSMTPEYVLNYKGLFQMPSPSSVVGFQQNVVNPSNDFLRKDNSTTTGVEVAIQYVQQYRTETPGTKKGRKTRRGKKKSTKNINSDLNVLDERVLSFLMRGVENRVTKFIGAAREISSNQLYATITNNLKEICSREMDLNVDVACFGSRIIGVGTAKSDLDLNISITDSLDNVDGFLENFKTILKNDSNWQYVTYIKSRVSLVRAFHIGMSIDCDITVNNDLAMVNTELVKYFYSIQPECHKVAAFIRTWAEKANIYPHMNTYTMNLMVFYYFQSKGFLPKVVDLVEATTTNYWPNKFQSKSLAELNMEMATNFKELCVDFMDFYAHRVNFESNILSIYTGSTISKDAFLTDEYLRENDCFQGLYRYKNDNPKAADNLRINFSMAMCIQDPFSHDHNISRCFGRATLNRLKTYCNETCEVLKQLNVNNSP